MNSILLFNLSLVLYVLIAAVTQGYIKAKKIGRASCNCKELRGSCPSRFSQEVLDKGEHYNSTNCESIQKCDSLIEFGFISEVAVIWPIFWVWYLSWNSVVKPFCENIYIPLSDYTESLFKSDD